MSQKRMVIPLRGTQPLTEAALRHGKYEGPTVRLDGRCSDCRHLAVMRALDATTPATFYCTHGATSPTEGRRLDGAHTPRDCPLWDVGVERLRTRERRAKSPARLT